ncbi:low molecular weight phosphatase family protein [Paroceanicella profunda]|uniref:Low molecular weight phosphatase family protein n=1 Tax=Paroceanicella profunda TaxID=2579971 RepID=A0A5B8FH65_9RHOB|nr:low molecular weight phosphatase family protein [Paroceanicella profunda]QDL91827.1 low molecular weight phosphatase family protein [Paroceanicella profunda]
MAPRPHSVLFCCDYNAVRSPLAEGIMKSLYGREIYVQSAGVKHDIEVDGFAVTVASELGITLEKHRARSFDEMQEWGDDLGGYDLIVALSPAAQRHAQELTRYNAVEVEFWPVLDPTGLGENREDKLSAYRQTRDQILQHIRDRFG